MVEVFCVWFIINVFIVLFIAAGLDDEQNWNCIKPTLKYCKENFNLAGTIICTGIVTIFTLPATILMFLTLSLMFGTFHLWEGFKYIFRKRK